MSKQREESVERYVEWCKSWYGNNTYITEEFEYMLISGEYLDTFQVTSCRNDGWLFCGNVNDSYIFTWEGD